MKNETRSAFIAIVGRPNVGKSSILNRLLGEKLAIVTQKPQTTRSRITGVLTIDSVQFVFIDTPGLHKPHTKLSEYMVKQVNESVADVDAAVLVVEAQGEWGEAEQSLVESFQALGLPAVLAINKVDLLKDKTDLLKRIEEVSSHYDFDAVIPVSALRGEGIQELLSRLDTYAMPGPHFFESDALTDQPERNIVAEILREKILLNMSDEIPHGTAVEVEAMKERPEKNIIDLSCVIYCEKASHKGMIIGKGGRMLKKIASEARSDMERFLDVKVNLQCWVKVQEDWRNRDKFIKSLGYQ